MSNCTVELTGNLGATPELRYTPSGRAVCNLSVATSDRYTNGAGERVESTEWHMVQAWGPMAERAAGLRKGEGVLVRGSLRTERWTDKAGVERFTTRVLARRIDRLSPLPEAAAAGGEPAGQGGQGTNTPAAPADAGPFGDGIHF